MALLHKLLGIFLWGEPMAHRGSSSWLAACSPDCSQQPALPSSVYKQHILSTHGSHRTASPQLLEKDKAQQPQGKMLLQPQDTRSGGNRGPHPASPHPRRSDTREAARSQGQTQSCPARRCYLPAAPGLPVLLFTEHVSNSKSQNSTNSHPFAEKEDQETSMLQ